MSFSVSGLLTAVYKKNDFKNFETGEFTQGGDFVQITVYKPMEDGSQQADLINFKTNDPSLYKPFILKQVNLACHVSYWSMNGNSGVSYQMIDKDNQKIIASLTKSAS